MSGRTYSNILGSVGAVVCGVVGYLIFRALWNVGLYGLLLPGAFLGLGCNLLARHRSTIRGLLCALVAVALGLLSEWSVAPFQADPSLGYFLRHLDQLDRGWSTLGLIALGAGFAFWWGRTPQFASPILPAPDRAGNP